MVHEIKTLKEAIRPILWLNYIFCMGVFEIPVNRPRPFFSIVYVVLMLTGYFFIVYQGIIIFQENFGSDYIIFYFVVTINIMVATLAIILFWKKCENMPNIIKRSSMADITLDMLGLKREYQKISHRTIIFVILWTMGMILLSSMYLLWMYPNIKSSLQIFYFTTFLFIPIMINSVVDVTFCAFVTCIQVKFRRTNILLNNVVQCASKSNIFKIPDEHDDVSDVFIRTRYADRKDRIMHLMQTLRHLHLEITRIAWQVNSTYCMQLLLELAVHFTIVTVSFYCLYCSFCGHNVRMAPTSEKIIAMLVWACIYSFKIILMNNLCTTVSNEAYKTGEIVQSFDGSSLDDDLRKEIHQFTQQIVLNSLKFTAAGFFTIDNSLTGKFFATVTTYVVILIQMNTPA
ncbi:Gr16 [Eciton burchellii]|nr:Gr16 [Eciton burchellii]